MNSRIWIIVIVVLIVAIVGYAGFAWFAASPSQTATSTNNGNPFGGGTGGGTQGGLTIPTKNGGSVTVPDFREGKDSVSEGDQRYYYLTDNQNTQGASAEYDIQYGTDGSVTIALLSEPIGTARIDAEQELRTFFPLSDNDLCSLDVIVGVPNYVSDSYSGQNLGLSFCPGSVKLPTN